MTYFLDILEFFKQYFLRGTVHTINREAGIMTPFFLNILEFFKQYHPRTSFLVSPSWKFKYIRVPFPPFNLSDEYLLDILCINELPPRFELSVQFSMPVCKQFLPPSS